MTGNILKPLATFCTESKSQRFIKNAQNLGDAWRTLSEPSSLDHAGSVVIETSFGLTFTCRKDFTSLQEFSTKFDITSPDTVASQKGQDAPVTSTRHFRIFGDYGTDFIWLNDNDPAYKRESSYIETEDALFGLPREVCDNFDAWVEIYTANFKKRCDEPGDYSVPVFPSAVEEAAWGIAGFLLAWRIALAPHVGSVELTVGREKYLLQRGEDIRNAVTHKFLEDQAVLLAKTERVE